MSIQKVLSNELDVREYVAQLGLNPDNVFYQSISARNISTSNAQWTITSPNKRSYLLSYAVVNWQPVVTCRRASDNEARDFDVSIQDISLKPGLAFANAMSSITMSVNGNTITLSQPRRFMEGLTMANVTAEECRKCFASGYPEKMGGQLSVATPGINTIAEPDHQFMRNEQAFDNRALRSNGSTNYGAFDNVNLSANNGIQEPLIVPPFNPFAKLKAGMPSYMWFSKMSDVIPNVDRLEIDVQFQNLTASVLYYRYAEKINDAGVAPFLDITSLAADLKLYWYEVPVNTSIPRSIDLNTWNVREYQTPIVSSAPGAGIVGLTSDLIQLNSVPTLIMVHVEVNKDDGDYKCQAASRDDDLAGTAVAIDGVHSWDSYAEIQSLQFLLGDRPNVISTNFTQRELYALTQKNSKKPYPYDFEDWRSSMRPTLTAAGVPIPGNPYARNGSKCVVFLRPKDIAEKISDGVFAPNSFQVTGNFTIRDGTHGYAPASNKTYRLYIHLFYGKHFLRIEPDKAQFQEQSIPLDTARRLTNPVLETQGVSGLGSPLEGLRLRNDSEFPNIQSRV